ncbi:MAG: zinc-binding dehydrogenase [Candidatus Flexifilum sp.]|jgi:NADPH:quinone reductase-like Zn-dependent oxidoreductase
MMRAVVIDSYSPGFDHLRVEQRPIPRPGPGEVLVQIAAAPLNPSDLMFVQGLYGLRKGLPVVPGFEGSGTIAAVGPGVDEAHVGQRVACFAGAGDGTWAEYLVTGAANCLPVPDAIGSEDAAMLLVNPLTARALIERAQESATEAIVQTAAASALGQMIIRLAARRGLTVINVVRRPEQVELLKGIGAEYILDSSEPTFEKHLREACRSLNAALAFDAVGGELTGVVLRCLVNGGCVTVYGGLAGAPAVIGVDQLIFRRKRVDGFWLSAWLAQTPADARLAAWMDVCADADTLFKSQVRARYPFDRAADAVRDYAAQMTGGKVVLTP